MRAVLHTDRLSENMDHTKTQIEIQHRKIIICKIKKTLAGINNKSIIAEENDSELEEIRR